MEPEDRCSTVPETSSVSLFPLSSTTIESPTSLASPTSPTSLASPTSPTSLASPTSITSPLFSPTLSSHLSSHDDQEIKLTTAPSTPSFTDEHDYIVEDISEDNPAPPKKERHLSKSYDKEHLGGRKRSNALSNAPLALGEPENAPRPSVHIQRDQVTTSVILAQEKVGTGYFVSFHKFTWELTHARFFKWFMMFIILVNTVAIGFETTLESNDHKNLLIMGSLDDFFLACYTLEFILKFYSDRRSYWFNCYNLFDFVILLVAYLDIALQYILVSADKFTTVMQVLRSSRSLRTLKIINFVPGVQVIASALVKTLRQLIGDVLLLLMLLMFVFSIMGFYLFGVDATFEPVIESWGNLGNTLLSLFTIFTADRWHNFIYTLVAGGNSDIVARSYVLFFLVIGHFIISNLFIAVIITNIERSSTSFKLKLEQEKDIRIQETKRNYWIRSRREVKKMMKSVNMDGESNFTELATEFYWALQKRDFTVMSDLKTNVLWLDTVNRELGRSVRSFKRFQNIQRDMVDLLAPVCNASVEDTRKSSISQHQRYVVQHKIAGFLMPGRRESTGKRISFLQR